MDGIMRRCTEHRLETDCDLQPSLPTAKRKQIAQACSCDMLDCQKFRYEYCAEGDKENVPRVSIPAGKKPNDVARAEAIAATLGQDTALVAGARMHYLYHYPREDCYTKLNGAGKTVIKVYQKRKAGRLTGDRIERAEIGPASPTRLKVDKQTGLADGWRWVVPDRPRQAIADSPSKRRKDARDPADLAERQRLKDLEELVAGKRSQRERERGRMLGRRLNEAFEEKVSRQSEEIERLTAEVQRLTVAEAAAKAEAEVARAAPALSAQRLHDSKLLQRNINVHTGVADYSTWRALIGLMRVYYPSGLRPPRHRDEETMAADIARAVETRCPTEPGYQNSRAAYAAAVPMFRASPRPRTRGSASKP